MVYKKSERTYHSSKGLFTNDNDKETQDNFYNSKLNDRLKRFKIDVDTNLDELFGEEE